MELLISLSAIDWDVGVILPNTLMENRIIEILNVLYCQYFVAI